MKIIFRKNKEFLVIQYAKFIIKTTFLNKNFLLSYVSKHTKSSKSINRLAAFISQTTLNKNIKIWKKNSISKTLNKIDQKNGRAKVPVHQYFQLTMCLHGILDIKKQIEGYYPRIYQLQKILPKIWYT